MEWPAKSQETEFSAIRSKGKRRTASSLSRPKNRQNKRQNRANLLIMVSSRFQRSIQVEWPAEAQETEFGAIRSRGKRRAGSSGSQPKNPPKDRQNRANLLIMVSSRFQRLIPVEWPAKAQETEFSAIRSKGKRRTASSLSRPKNRQNKRQNRANLLIMVSSRFQRLIQVEWPAKAQETEFGVIRSRGKRRTASSLSRLKNRQKKRQNRAILLIMVSSHFQRLIQVEWPAKTQET